MEKPHPDGSCGKPIVVTDNSPEYISPCDGSWQPRLMSVVNRQGVKDTRLEGEVALEFSTDIVFPPYRTGVPVVDGLVFDSLFAETDIAQITPKSNVVITIAE